MLWIVRNQAALEASDTGVVHDYIKSAFILQNQFDCGLPVGFFAHIETKIVSRIAERGRKRGSNLISNVAHEHNRTLIYKCACNLFAYSRSGSSDEGYLT